MPCYVGAQQGTLAVSVCATFRASLSYTIPVSCTSVRLFFVGTLVLFMKRLCILFFFFLPFLSLCVVPSSVSAQSPCEAYFDLAPSTGLYASVAYPACSDWVGTRITIYGEVGTVVDVYDAVDALLVSLSPGTTYYFIGSITEWHLYNSGAFTASVVIDSDTFPFSTPTPVILVTATPVLTPTPAPIDVLVERSNQSFQLNIFLGAGVVGLLALLIVRAR